MIMPNVLFFVSDGYTEFNSSNYRVSIPVGALIRAGYGKNVRIMHISHWMKQSMEGVAAASWADVIVLQRVLVDTSIEYAHKWKLRGKAVLVDFDDAYDLIRPDNAAYKFWGKGEVEMRTDDGHRYDRTLGIHPIDQFKEGLKHVTGFITPSKRLIADWEAHAPGVYIPNYLDLPRYNSTKKRNNGDRLVIGWGGSLSHVPGFTDSGVSEALGRITDAYREVYFMLVGDKRIKPHLPIQDKKQLFTPYVKYTVWPYILRRYDIGIAPLFGGYDCRRSHLKVMEYIALGIPYVATDSIVYDAFRDCASGILVPQGDLSECDLSAPLEWHNALVDMLENIQEYREKAELERVRFLDLYDVDRNVDYLVSTFTQASKL